RHRARDLEPGGIVGAVAPRRGGGRARRQGGRRAVRLHLLAPHAARRGRSGGRRVVRLYAVLRRAADLPHRGGAGARDGRRRLRSRSGRAADRVQPAGGERAAHGRAGDLRGGVPPPCWCCGCIGCWCRPRCACGADGADAGWRKTGSAAADVAEDATMRQVRWLAAVLCRMIHPSGDPGVPDPAQTDARFRCLFENNHTVMLIMDAFTRRIVDANPAAAAFYGQSREELTQLHVEDISTTRLVDLQIMLRSALESPSLPIVARHRLKDGTLRDVEIYNGPFSVGARRLIYALIHDITERRRTEATLRLQSAALNAAANATVITDRQGTIVWLNPAFTSLTGYGALEAIGHNPRELLKSGVHDADFYANLWQTIL